MRTERLERSAAEKAKATAHQTAEDGRLQCARLLRELEAEKRARAAAQVQVKRTQSLLDATIGGLDEPFHRR